MAYKPVVLIVLDGVGVSTVEGETPFSVANIPTIHEIEKYWPFTTLRASGAAVGLPWGEEGNSEVGHLTMGSGRVVYHHLPRIINAIHDESFFKNEAFLKAAEHVKAHNSQLHLMGLFSSGSVHAYVDHLYALLDFAKQQQIEKVMIHPFTDGRDSPPDEGAKMFKQLQERVAQQYPNARIASIIGRSYAMDRDEHWDFTQKAYDLFVNGVGTAFQDPVAYIEESYKKNVTDEFIEPGFLADAEGKPIGRMAAGDAVIYYDFREDSTRQLTATFVEDSFIGFSRQKLADLLFVTMTEYDKRFSALVAFRPLEIAWPLARVLSQAKKTQLHIAETEKYAHVTYFFNGGVEKLFEGEERMLIPSPRSIHFNEHPEMAAAAITDAVVAGISKYDFILVNYANGDMVGHTGDFTSTVKALEALDFSVGKVITAVLEAGGAVVITGDHGNAEEKRYRVTGEPRTKHTTNPVPLYLITQDLRAQEPRSGADIKNLYKDIGGVLTDVAPTVLELMELSKPGEMSGISLLEKLKTMQKKLP